MFESRTGSKSNIPYLLRLSKLYADPLRVRILSELTMRPMSPKEFFDEFGGGSLSRVSRHFKTLLKYDWIELVDEKSGGKRRGAVEHFYRATESAAWDEAAWAGMPSSAKELVTWQGFATLAEEFKAAVEAGTIDARPERHFTWCPARYDELGWERVLAKTMELYDFAADEQVAAGKRMEKTGEEPIPALVALAVFETPLHRRKQREP